MSSQQCTHAADLFGVRIVVDELLGQWVDDVERGLTSVVLTGSRIPAFNSAPGPRSMGHRSLQRAAQWRPADRRPTRRRGECFSVPLFGRAAVHVALSDSRPLVGCGWSAADDRQRRHSYDPQRPLAAALGRPRADIRGAQAAAGAERSGAEWRAAGDADGRGSGGWRPVGGDGGGDSDSDMVVVRSAPLRPLLMSGPSAIAAAAADASDSDPLTDCS